MTQRSIRALNPVTQVPIRIVISESIPRCILMHPSPSDSKSHCALEDPHGMASMTGPLLQCSKDGVGLARSGWHRTRVGEIKGRIRRYAAYART
jgi:hypothetical protein